MPDDFDKWNNKKKQLHVRTNAPTFKEREVWWCSLGANIGTEQNGKGQNFTRPVLVLRKFSTSQFKFSTSSTVLEYLLSTRFCEGQVRYGRSTMQSKSLDAYM